MTILCLGFSNNIYFLTVSDRKVTIYAVYCSVLDGEQEFEDILSARQELTSLNATHSLNNMDRTAVA